MGKFNDDYYSYKNRFYSCVMWVNNNQSRVTIARRFRIYGLDIVPTKRLLKIYIFKFFKSWHILFMNLILKDITFLFQMPNTIFYILIEISFSGIWKLSQINCPPLRNVKNRIDGVIVSVPASSAVDHEFEPRSDQTKVYKIGTCFFSAKHAAYRKKSKDSLARNLNFFSEWREHVHPRTVISES